MIERVCRGLDEAGLLDSSCIVTHRSQVEITRKSVGNQVALLAEPQKRELLLQLHWRRAIYIP